MGEAGPAWTAGLAPYEAMTILPRRRVLAARGVPAARRRRHLGGS